MNPFTRRELAAALTGTAALLAQNPPLRAQSSNPEDELKASQAQLRDNADQLDKFPLPITVEPATIFKP
jgi:hypothetical protein